MYYFLYTLLALLGLYGLVCMGVYFYQERLIFFPEVLPADYRFHFEEAHQEVYLENTDAQNRLHALWFRKNDQKSERVVLYFHGNAASLASWGSVAKDFVRLGYDVLMIDYRGYGKSIGKTSQERFLKDAQKAYEFVSKHYPQDNITVLGRSLGTGLACYVASVGKVERLILETPYYSFASLVSHHAPYLPAFLLFRYNFRSDKYVLRLACPVHIFHGTADSTIPYTQGARLAKIIPQVDFITIEGGTHNNLSEYPSYQKALTRILKK